MRVRTVAARRTDPQPLFQGSGRRAPDRALRASAAGSASCAASVRSPALRRRVPAPRALAVPLEHSSARRRRRASSLVSAGARAAAARARPLVVVSRCSDARGVRAAVSRRVTIGWRRGRTRSSATCSGSGTRALGAVCDSIEQLVVGVGAGDGLGRGPARARPERARFVRAHRKSVQRWLDDLQAAGLVAHEPERDGGGRWWRTQIVLLAAPDPTAEELRVAAQRARGWRARERARRRRGAAWRRGLAAIRGARGMPSRATRARLARAWTRRRRTSAPPRGSGSDRSRAGALSGCWDSDASLRGASYVGGLAGRLRSERYGRAVAQLGLQPRRVQRQRLR